MKETWSRAQPPLIPDRDVVGALIHRTLPKAKVEAVQLLPGGLANTNLKVVLSSGAAPVVLRLYQRDPRQGRMEWAISAQLAGQVPLARFIDFSDDRDVVSTPYAILEWIEGDRLDAAISTFDEADWASVGRSIGRSLAAVHGVTFGRFGFFSPALRVVRPVDLGSSGLRAYLEQCLVGGPGGARLGRALTSRLLPFVERKGSLLDAWLDQPRLQHADFVPENMLVCRKADESWALAAILDWEFAYSGSPAADFGCLLRGFDAPEGAFAIALTDSYRSAGQRLPQDWFAIAKLADLFAWAEMLSRPRADPAMIVDARRVIEATLRL